MPAERGPITGRLPSKREPPARRLRRLRLTHALPGVRQRLQAAIEASRARSPRARPARNEDASPRRRYEPQMAKLRASGPPESYEPIERRSLCCSPSQDICRSTWPFHEPVGLVLRHPRSVVPVLKPVLALASSGRRMAANSRARLEASAGGGSGSNASHLSPKPSLMSQLRRPISLPSRPSAQPPEHCSPGAPSCWPR